MIQARLEIIRKYLKRTFGSASDQIVELTNELSGDQLSNLADAMYDFNTVEDANAWLARLDHG